MSFKIGLISDTHGYMDPEVRRYFQGVDHILHGGDVGAMSILLELEDIAPVTAVLGNVDDPGTRLREFETVELGNLRFLLHHIVDPARPSDALARKLNRVKPHVVLFGHTHKPFDSVKDGVRFLNPGYAGRQRFDLPRTAAILELGQGEGEGTAEIRWLELKGESP